MLDILPVEVLEIIIGHLPSASSAVNLSLSNHKLHTQISADKYALLKSFVQSRFPSIHVPPVWRDAAIALTARSRAWDRRAFMARECKLPGGDVLPGTRNPAGPKAGFVPAIDSYETWTDSIWAERKEVLVWGAAGRLRLRVTRNGKEYWSTYRTPFDHAPQNDIMNVKILRPDQNRNLPGETSILRRANNRISKIISQPGKDAFIHLSSFKWESMSQPIDSMDVNDATEPLLAACNSREVRLYQVDGQGAVIEPCDVVQLEQHHNHKTRMRCAKFLSAQRLALGVQFLDGRTRAPIEIYQVTPTGLREVPTHLRDVTLEPVTGRHCANAIAPLDAISTLAGRPGDVFLSGWTDGTARLYDLRSGDRPRTEYHDTVDDGQILSLLPIGHERFLAGSHHNACLKTFDLRMSGGRAYSYLNAPLPRLKQKDKGGSNKRLSELYTMQRDINIFLALHIPRVRRLWEPLPQRQDTNLPRYRGSVYSLSSPSASSPSVYAGIENHVIQLDFVSTDDARNGRAEILGLDLPKEQRSTRPVFNLSCYERPELGYETSDAILLRKQVGRTSHWAPPERHLDEMVGVHDSLEDGWDERWRLASYDRPKSQRDWR